MSKELRQMVKKIQFERGLTIEEVAESVKYSRVHLQREMKKEGDSPVIDILKEKYRGVLHNVSQASGQISDIRDQVPNHNEILNSINKLIESNQKILESNSEAIASNKVVTEKVANTNDKLANTNAELVQMLKEKSVAQNIPSNFDWEVLANNQLSIMAQMQWWLHREAERETGGDPEKMQKFLQEVGKTIVENAGVRSSKGSRKSSHHS